MIKSGIFSLNKKLSEQQKELADKFNVRFLVDDDGVDWYELQKQFGESTWKIAFNPAGRVVAFSQDASSLFPLGVSVLECAELPPGVSVTESWYVDLKTLVIYRNEVELAERQRAELINAVTQQLLPLQQAREDDDITAAESEALTALTGYRRELRRLDVSNAPNIQWPTPPAQ